MLTQITSKLSTTVFIKYYKKTAWISFSKNNVIFDWAL